MSDHKPIGSLDAVAQKWRDLAERRHAHFVDLFKSGRWRRYYSEEQFLHRLREALRASERWAMLAPSSEEPRAIGGETATGADSASSATATDASKPVDAEPAIDLSQRSAA
jgi:uncharacterized repeat protein (TIGR03809 family)